MLASLPRKSFPDPLLAANLTLIHLQTTAAQTGLRLLLPRRWRGLNGYQDNSIRGRRVSFRILPQSPPWTPGQKDHPNLYPSGRQRPSTFLPYQLVRQTYRGTDRRVNATCWHGHRDFLAVLFDFLPDLTVRTARAVYRGRDHFHQIFPSTDINIGSQMQPLSYSDACRCSTRVRNHTLRLNLKEAK